MGQVVFRIVEEAVAQAGSGDCTYEECYQERVKRFGRQAFPFVERAHDVVADREYSGYKKQTVPSYAEVSDSEDKWVDIPCDCE